MFITKLLDRSRERTQRFVMKAAGFHHNLKFCLYIASKRKNSSTMQITEIQAPRCPCRTQFFLIFSRQQLLLRYGLIFFDEHRSHSSQSLWNLEIFQPDARSPARNVQMMKKNVFFDACHPTSSQHERGVRRAWMWWVCLSWLIVISLSPGFPTN